MKKILALILLSITAVSLFAGCGGEKKNEGVICETEQIAVIENDALKLVQGKVEDIYGDAGNLFVASKDKMYEYLSNEKQNGAPFDIIGNSIDLVNRSCKLLKMQDGTLTGFYYNSELNRECCFTGLKSEGLIYAFVKPGKQVAAIRETDGKFYIETYNINKYGAIAFVSQQELMKEVASTLADKDKEANIEEIKVSNLSELALRLSNGKIIFYKVIAGFGEKHEVEIKKAEKIFAIHSSRADLTEKSVVYKKSSEDSAVFLHKVKGGTKDSTVKISLPGEYKVNDINKVLLDAKGFMIVFNDGSIYVSKAESVQDLMRLEHLSKLNQDGKLKSVVVYNGFAALQDDGKVYKVEY